jgi:hypothetical protein
VSWCAATMVFMALYPDLLAAPQLQNPIGLTGSVGDLMRGVQDSALLVGVPLALVLLAALSLILRFRRSEGVERQQLKWFAYVVGLAAANLALPLYLIADWLGPVTAVVHWLLLMSIAGAIGLAILRYRLYDIDRIISRTLVYGLLTGLLGLVYVGLVLSLASSLEGSVLSRRAGRSLAPPWPWPPCSSRSGTVSSRPWTDGSTGAAMTPPRPSRPSASGCARRSTWTVSRPSCWRWSSRRCSRPPRPCGCGHQPGSQGAPGPKLPTRRAGWSSLGLYQAFTLGRDTRASSHPVLAHPGVSRRVP